ncbi:whey acidic protein-like isoform X2 [Ambystoma mexicanum]|uniref:whey acidic protein-like isoform X2 n=1 Tax=Ambystoma mexicanum TaxID=8296 RepID=UPI0037E7A6B0
MERPHATFIRLALLVLSLEQSWGAWPSPTFIIAKPGMCPLIRFKCYGDLDIYCQGDHDCNANQKCCNFRCKIGCTDIVSAKLGRCPADTNKCNRTEPNDCYEDSDCLGIQKCCQFRCGLKCKFPVRAKPGNCPEHAPMCSLAEKVAAPKCLSDDDCPGKTKCCVVRCNQDCTEPRTSDKPGNCPPEDENERCVYPMERDECLSDGNCPLALKCCGSCNKKCVASARGYDPELDGVAEIIIPVEKIEEEEEEIPQGARIVEL